MRKSTLGGGAIVANTERSIIGARSSSPIAKYKIEKKNSPTPNDSKPAAKKFRTGAVDTNVMQVNFTVGNHGEFVTKKPVRCPECDAVVA